MEARLSSQKLSDLGETLCKWRNKLRCTLLELQQLTGYLQFCFQVIPLSKSFICALYNFQSSFNSNLTMRRIPFQAQKDIKWWSCMAVEWNGIRFISPSRAEIHVHTDASGKKGIGGYVGAQVFSQKNPQQY